MDRREFLKGLAVAPCLASLQFPPGKNEFKASKTESTIERLTQIFKPGEFTVLLGTQGGLLSISIHEELKARGIVAMSGHGFLGFSDAPKCFHAARTLSALAKQSNASVVLTLMGHPEMGNRLRLPLTLAHTRIYPGLEQCADSVVFLSLNHKDPWPERCLKYDVEVGKNRNGPLFKDEMYFNYETRKFTQPLTNCIGN